MNAERLSKRINIVRTMGFAIAVLGVLSGEGAFAPAQFLSSTPTANSVLESAPTEVLLTFNQIVTPVAVTIVGNDGKALDDVGEPLVNGRDVVVALGRAPAPGAYVVSFRVLSSDAHTINGGFRFRVQGENEGLPSSSADARLSEQDTGVARAVDVPSQLDTAAVLERIVLVAFLLAAGLFAFRLLVTVPDSRSSWLAERTVVVARWGALLTLLYLAVAATEMGGTMPWQPAAAKIALQSGLGHSLTVAFAGFVLLVVPTFSRNGLTWVGAAALIISRSFLPRANRVEFLVDALITDFDSERFLFDWSDAHER